MSHAIASLSPHVPDTIQRSESSECIMCGSDNYRLLIEAKDRHTASETFQVVECLDCGLAFTNPRPKQEFMSDYYPEDYSPHQHVTQRSRRISAFLETAVLRDGFGYPPGPSRLDKIFAVLGRILIHRSRRKLGWIDYREGGKLLDFGCGAGTFLKDMERAGWSVMGIDISERVADRVEDELGIPVIVGTLPHPKLEPESFDVVTMWNALEHVHEPREVLQAAWDVLRPGGELVIGVPNIASWSFHHFLDTWFGLELPRHTVHFTPGSLCQMLHVEQFHLNSVQHVGRDGWIRHSASVSRGAIARACQWKPFRLALASYSQWTKQADFIRVSAIKPRIDDRF